MQSFGGEQAVSPTRAVGLILVILVESAMPRAAPAQTPSPLQEWQYSGGIILEKMFRPDLPDWSYLAGIGVEERPLYTGAKAFRTLAGPTINVLYRDVAFASTGEGIGVNVLRGPNYRAGLSLGYDLGRFTSSDEADLHGLTNIPRAPVLKAFGSYVISKDFPMVLRADVRQSILRGRDGLVGDLEAYMPLPGSSQRFFMFAGPSLTFATQSYVQKRFGVTTAESATSGYAPFLPRGGFNGAGAGFSGNGFLTDHWILSVDAAVDWLLGNARASPFIQREAQPVVAVSIAYRW